MVHDIEAVLRHWTFAWSGKKDPGEDMNDCRAIMNRESKSEAKKLL